MLKRLLMGCVLMLVFSCALTHVAAAEQEDWSCRCEVKLPEKTPFSEHGRLPPAKKHVQAAEMKPAYRPWRDPSVVGSPQSSQSSQSLRMGDAQEALDLGPAGGTKEADEQHVSKPIRLDFTQADIKAAGGAVLPSLAAVDERGFRRGHFNGLELRLDGAFLKGDRLDVVLAPVWTGGDYLLGASLRSKDPSDPQRRTIIDTRACTHSAFSFRGVFQPRCMVINRDVQAELQTKAQPLDYRVALLDVGEFSGTFLNSVGKWVPMRGRAERVIMVLRVPWSAAGAGSPRMVTMLLQSRDPSDRVELTIEDPAFNLDGSARDFTLHFKSDGSLDHMAVGPFYQNRVRPAFPAGE